MAPAVGEHRLPMGWRAGQALWSAAYEERRSSRSVRNRGTAHLPARSMMVLLEQEVSMGKRTWIVAAALAATAAAFATPVAANTTIGVQIGVPAPVFAQPVFAQPVYPQPVFVRPAPMAVYEQPLPAHRGWVHGQVPVRS